MFLVLGGLRIINGSKSLEWRLGLWNLHHSLVANYSLVKVRITFKFFIFVEPKIAKLLDSVPPEVK